MVLKPGKVKAFVWDNRDIIVKQLMIRSGQNWGSTSLDEVSKFDQDKKGLIYNEVFEMEVLTVRAS